MKIIKLIGLAFLGCLVAVYLNIVVPQPKTSASVMNIDGRDLKITSNESVSCPDGNAANNVVSSYGGSFTLTNQLDHSQTLSGTVHKFFCAGSVQNCRDHDNPFNFGPVTIGPKGSGNDSTVVGVDNYSGTVSCNQPGTYQVDIDINGYGANQAAMWCFAKTPACQQPTSTPVPPTATPTVPVPTATPTTPVPHYGCVNNACVQVEGGLDTCNPNDANACKTPTHLTCIDNACRRVNGAGTDSCKRNKDCAAPTATPTPGNNQQCPSGYSVEIINSQVFCMQQNQNQDQGQQQKQETNVNNTNNNTINNNINLASYAPQQQQQQQQLQVQPAPTTNKLPSTGSPLAETLTLLGMLPTGLIIKKFTKLG